uniref:very-long-chain (3R)-3-hydroxyacyl-CoA dehydratase n=1 Tax=Albugo laibachii Nc14 TaxID=890382 RepID=F0WK60_9STRA|nr:conserved hypothetical protein [Albugo laibachii Nc14]|eukprot:CCA21662.1 conserved hypothetical protein [Albugo laibachii Nc14]
MHSIYLTGYNALCAIGWTTVFLQSVGNIHELWRAQVSWNDVALASWNSVHTTLLIVQSLAVLEIVHSAYGLVRSPLFSTTLQVFSRLWLVWGINVLCPPSRSHWGFLVMILSWSLVEVPRYTFYAFHLFRGVPRLLFYVRYHLFLVLYPTGVLGETLCMMNALPYLSKRYAIQLPNAHNVAISMHSVVIFILMVYIPGLFIMYNHMLIQRKRAYANRTL